MQVIMIEHADTFRSMEFVGADRDEIGTEFLRVNRKFPCNLNGIHMEGSLVVSEQVPNFLDRQQLASFVIGIHDRNENGIVT